MEVPDNGGLEEFRHFQKEDFEADWTKMAERNFGRIYKVKLKLWRETFAMKCFSTALSSTTFYRRMIEEASKMEKVKFNYLVSIYGVCSDPPAVVMEYMSNGSLDTLLSTHDLMWPKKFQMIHEVTMGMNFLHSMKPPLLHLNLKPANILLDDHLHTKISDFGLIKWEEYSDKMEFIKHLATRGNISYIPPEIFTQNPEPPGTKFDVYSFAIVIWEILTQKKPCPGDHNMMTVIMRVSFGKRPSVEKIPDDKPQECQTMVDIMQRCWLQNGSDRPPFSDTVRETEALSEVLKIPDVVRACKEKEKTHKLANVTMSTCVKKDTRSEMDRASGAENSNSDIIGVLSRGDFEHFKEILRKEHLSAVYSDGNSLLHYAVSSGEVETVKLVLSLGAVVDSQSAKGYTPLIVSVLHKFYDICSLLMAHGADVNLADGDQWTPLHFAAQGGDDKTARLLLTSSARADATEKDGWTPLHLAAQNGHENVVRIVLPRMAAVDGQVADGRTALHLSSVYGHLAIAKLLLGKGADPNQAEGGGSTALHLSAEEGHFRVARLLVNSGADVNLTDNRDYSALHWGALKGHTGICRLLLGKGAHPNPRTFQGWTPLHLAALRGHPATVLLLEEHQGVINAQGDSGWTALHLACYHHQEKVVAVLLTAGADPNMVEDSGWTALHLACSSGSFASVLQLISHRASVNAQNYSLATPLHLAARNGSAPIVKALLLNGAKKDIKDARGCTAKMLAEGNQNEEVVWLLDDQNPG